MCTLSVPISHYSSVSFPRLQPTWLGHEDSHIVSKTTSIAILSLTKHNRHETFHKERKATYHNRRDPENAFYKKAYGHLCRGSVENKQTHHYWQEANKAPRGRVRSKKINQEARG